MRSIRFVNVTKRFQGETIFENLNLTIPSGKIFTLLGPSGSGKTTILRLIAGFEQVDSGSIYLDDQDITYTPINERQVNTVFQNYALFPHLNVFENVAFSQRIKGLPAEVVEDKAMKILATVHLEKYAYKSIQQLSGGQQQRVAIARAIINEPAVLLLDEPLAALDQKLRERMLIELIDLQSTLKTTFVYVTHDRLEALTVADTITVLNQDGMIEQSGTPKEIYEFPNSSFVAQFVGSTNIFKAVLEPGDHPMLRVAGLGTFEITEVKEWMKQDKEILMSVRPEKIDISKSPLPNFSNEIQGTVRSIVYHGRSTQYNVLLSNGQIVQVFEQNEEHFPKEIIDYEDMVYLYWQKENAVLLEQ